MAKLYPRHECNMLKDKGPKPEELKFLYATHHLFKVYINVKLFLSKNTIRGNMTQAKTLVSARLYISYVKQGQINL